MTVKPKQSMAQNKLLVLYLLRAAGMGLSELQLVRIMGELGFMGYFDLKEALFELMQNGHARAVETPHTSLFSITEQGARIARVLADDLRLSFRESIDAYLRKTLDELKMETQLVGEYFKLGEREYRVLLKVLEQNASVFEIALTVYSKAEAQTMVENWRKNAISLYKDIVLRLS